MELVAIVRVLWRRRVVAAIGAPLIVAFALVGTHRVSLSPFRLTPPQAVQGVATAKVLVDTPHSQLVDLGPKLVDDLPMRVGVLANTLVTDSSRASLAKEVGLPVGQISVASFGGGAPLKTPLARRLAEFERVSTSPYVVRLVADNTEPILTIVATAPSAAEAERIVRASVTMFTARVKFDGAHRGFVATPLGDPRVGVVRLSSGNAMTVAITLLSVCLWLFVVVVIGGLHASWTPSRKTVPAET